jgi:hypothetical protein
MFMSDWSSLMTPPPEGNPRQHAYSFMIRILATSDLSYNFLCLAAVTLSISLGGCVLEPALPGPGGAEDTTPGLSSI